jgi:hypothetical protein
VTGIAIQASPETDDKISIKGGRKMSKKILFCLSVFAFLATPLALAGEPKQASPWTSATTNGERMKSKLEFGFKNALTGWTEIFSEPVDAWQEKGNVLKGLGRGLCNAVHDTVGGILHIVTFPLKADIQLPEGGTNTFS